MTGRSPMRSVSAPHGTSVSMPPPVTAAKARPTSPRLSPNSLRTGRAERGQPHPQRRERAGADRARGEDDPAVARRHAAALRGALAVPARLGLVAAQRHRAPAPAPRRRAVVEARRARLRGADADARAPRPAGRACARRRARSRPARGAPGRAARARRERACRRRPARAASAARRAPSQPSMAATAAGRRGLARQRRLHADVDRLAQRARLAQAGARHRRDLGRAARPVPATGRDRRA